MKTHEPLFSVGQRVYWDKNDTYHRDGPPVRSDCGEVTSITSTIGGFRYTVKYDEDDSAPEMLYNEGELHALSVPEDDR